jgi:hypothetical protein
VNNDLIRCVQVATFGLSFLMFAVGMAVIRGIFRD